MFGYSSISTYQILLLYSTVTTRFVVTAVTQHGILVTSFLQQPPHAELQFSFIHLIMIFSFIADIYIFYSEFI